MAINNALVGIGATVISRTLTPKTWTLLNIETKDVIVGQYPHEGLSRSVGSNIAQISSLNRQDPILQFINGKTDTLSLRSRFRYEHIMSEDPAKALERLISWCKIDPIIRRPPVCVFSAGTSSLLVFEVLVDSVGDIEYSQPDYFGTIREIHFTVNFLRYTPFSIDDKQATDTRYARAKERDYYELLAQQEYGSPMLGVVIRQRHPKQLVLVPGSVVTLPSIEGIRMETPKQKSIQLKDAYGRKDTPARRWRQQWFERRATPYISFVLNITPRS